MYEYHVEIYKNLIAILKWYNREIIGLSIFCNRNAMKRIIVGTVIVSTKYTK